MKLILLFAMLLLGWQGSAHQTKVATIEPNTKYNHPTLEELAMTEYTPDTSATAVVLYSKCSVNYIFSDRQFHLVYDYEFKVKVLKPNGVSHANISIPYYLNIKDNRLRETVKQIDASAYNLEKGEIVRTKLKNDLIFKERLNDEYMLTKFSIPAVKQGTVFEYKFQLHSDFFFTIAPWKAQRNIPVLLAQYEITIPEYFKYNLEVQGSYSLTPKKETTRQLFMLEPPYPPGTIECKGDYLLFTGKQLPALHADNYIWCVDDYLSGVNLEIKGLEIPGEPYHSFTQTWNDIDRMLLENESFGGLLSMRNPYHKEMKSLHLDKLPSQLEQISAIFLFLKEKLSWNGQYSLYGNEVKKVIKNQTGSNADFNFILMSMLRDAQIPCYPVVMSRRDAGKLPISHPSILKLNTFIVGIADTDSTFVFLDGSIDYGFINVLSPILMVDQARIIHDMGASYWVNLSRLGKHQIDSKVDGYICPEGKIKGTRLTQYTGLDTYSFRKRYHNAKDSTAFISELETTEGINIKQFQAKNGRSFSPDVTEFFEFEKQLTVSDNHIYVNPLVFLHVSKCPFTQAERKLPIEIPYNNQLFQTTLLRIPEGYVIEEIPKPMKLIAKDGQSICQYNISQEQDAIKIEYVFSSSKSFYLPDEYQDVKAFWEKLTNKNNEMVVLRKL